ncbi:MAG: YggT family protein [Sulfurimonas sp.]|nr:YggT family protein [Sulfurimonas sp.]
MSELGNTIIALGDIFTSLIGVYIWVVIITVLLSFVNPDPRNPIVQFLYKATNPAYSFVKRYINTNLGGLDLAPLAIIMGLQVVMVLLNYLFYTLASLI